MAVILDIKTDATLEQVEEAVRNYNHSVSWLEGGFRVYVAPYDRYHLSLEKAAEILECNLDESIKLEIIHSEYD